MAHTCAAGSSASTDADMTGSGILEANSPRSYFGMSDLARRYYNDDNPRGCLIEVTGAVDRILN
jgi:hypothetical protein